MQGCNCCYCYSHMFAATFFFILYILHFCFCQFRKFVCFLSWTHHTWYTLLIHMGISLFNVTISNKALLSCTFLHFLWKHFSKFFFLLGHDYLMTALKPSGFLIIPKFCQVAIRPKTSLVTFSYDFVCHLGCAEQQRHR